MSAISNIVAFDGAAPPVSHTFAPVSVTREKKKVTAEWRENLSGVPVAACPRISMTLEEVRNGLVRVEQRVVVPVMESISGQNAAGYTAAPKVAYEDTTVTIGWFSSRSTQLGRRLVRQLAVNVWGGIATTVTPVQTGPAAELFDLLVAPT